MKNLKNIMLFTINSLITFLLLIYFIYFLITSFSSITLLFFIPVIVLCCLQTLYVYAYRDKENIQILYFIISIIKEVILLLPFMILGFLSFNSFGSTILYILGILACIEFLIIFFFIYKPAFIKLKTYHSNDRKTYHLLITEYSFGMASNLMVISNLIMYSVENNFLGPSWLIAISALSLFSSPLLILIKQNSNNKLHRFITISIINIFLITISIILFTTIGFSDMSGKMFSNHSLSQCFFTLCITAFCFMSFKAIIEEIISIKSLINHDQTPI